MSALVDFAYYADVYMGSEADETSFPALCAHASDVIGAMTHWRATAGSIGGMPPFVQELVKKAVCAQVDYFALNGVESATGEDGRGFTVGKVRVDGAAASSSGAGVMAAHIAPMAKMYLEQSGLMNPRVGVLPDMPMIGWW